MKGRQNPIAKALRSSHLQSKVVASKKAYKRNPKHKLRVDWFQT